MAKTRIIVVKLRKLLRIAVPIAIVLVLSLLYLIFFSPSTPKKENVPSSRDTACYRAGVYTTVVKLNDSSLNLEVVVDENHIQSVRLVNLDELTATMYPLIEPSVNHISAQLSSGTSPDEITLSESSKYTQTLLLEKIKETLETAKVSSGE